MKDKFWLTRACFFIVFLAQFSLANPIALPNTISEVQVIDTTHWSIEINGLYAGLNSFLPCDSVGLGTPNKLSNGSFGTPETFFAPTKKISFDSTSDSGIQRYIAVLTGTNFPKNKLLKNQLISIRLSNANGGPFTFNIQIDSTLRKSQSFVRVPTEYWYDANYGYGQPDEVLGHGFVYAKCDSPTIGKINNYNGICNALTGRVKDKKNNLLHGIMLHSQSLIRGGIDPSTGISISSGYTDFLGRFNIRQIASFPSMVTFYDSSSLGLISDKFFGPLYDEPGSTIDVGDIVLDDYPPTGIINRNVKEVKSGTSSLNVLGVFSAINQKGVKIVIANHSNAPSPITLSILTVKGQKIRDISSIISSAGTNTISWDGKNASGKKVPAGMYVVNLYSNNSLLQKSYGVIQ